MECPKCEGTMEVKRYGRKISVNRCDSCNGLFIKPDVLMAMKKEWMSEILDVGDPKIGRELDKVEDIACPECGTQMEKVSDDKQVHVWFESCPNCTGMFFDAGEFTDLKHDTLLDRLRDLVRGRR